VIVNRLFSRLRIPGLVCREVELSACRKANLCCVPDWFFVVKEGIERYPDFIAYEIRF